MSAKRLPRAASLFVALAVISGALSGARPARVGAQVPAPTTQPLTGPNVIYYPDPTGGKHASDTIAQGSSVGNKVCHFTVSGSGKAGTGASIGHELAFDPDTCRALFGIDPATPGSDRSTTSGTASTAITISHGTPRQAPNGSSADPTASGGGTGSMAVTCDNPGADTTHSYADAACIHSWFQDPVPPPVGPIHVNDVTNEVQWNPAPTCADAGYSTDSYYPQLDALTGWYIQSQTFSPYFGCDKVQSQTNVTFENDTFCLLMTTHTYYQPSTIEGDDLGNYAWWVSYDKDGGCNSLLSFNFSDS